MRIRSIKPEFWKSDSIGGLLSIPTRLTFIGLWNYVDDNGVGRDNDRLIAAELYALETDPAATLATVRRALDELSTRGRISRYTVEGKGYFAITNWSEHQKIDRPAKPRYPGPDDPAAMPVTSTYEETANSFDEDSSSARRGVSEGSSPEQGAGSREQVSGSPQGGATQTMLRAVDEGSAADAVGAYIEGAKATGKPRPSGKLVGKVGRDAKRLIGEGVPLIEIVDAARRCGESGWDDIDRERQNPRRGTAAIRSRISSEQEHLAGWGDAS